MKITVVQSDPVWKDKKSNFMILGDLLNPLRGKSDLVVLPEMFNTGFLINPADSAEAADGPTYDWMLSAAGSGNFALCGSYIVSDGGKFYNRFLFVTPEGTVFQYDKRHLFSMGAEDRYFSRGTERTVFRYMDFNICPFICYDLRFPVWMRNRMDYDLIIVSANWPEVRISVWNTLLRARAIENQSFVAGANRVGIDGEGLKYPGESVILNARGEVISMAESSNSQCLTAEVSIEELNDFRNRFPAWRDADDFTLQ